MALYEKGITVGHEYLYQIHANLRVDVETFHWISENFYLLVALEGRSENYQSHFDASLWPLGYLCQIEWESIQ